MNDPRAPLWVLPPFPVGETPNSCLRRLAGYNDIPSLAQAAKRLMARKPGLDAMPTGLQDFHHVLGDRYGSVADLLRDHTALGFYCCGLPMRRRAEQGERLVHVHKGPVRLCRLPVLFGHSEGADLACPICRTEQLDAWGFSYCDRRTCVPGVTVCGRHGCLLRALDGPPLLFDAQCSALPTCHQLAWAAQYAARVAGCIEVSPLQADHHKEAVVRCLASAGWTMDSGRIRLTPLISTFIEFFKGAFADTRLAVLATTPDMVEHAIRALFRDERAVDPTWCILFRWFAESCDCPQPRKMLCRREAVWHPSQEQLRDCLNSKGSLRSVSRLLGVSVSTLAVDCRRYGIEVRWRPKHIHLALRNAIKDALARGGRPSDVARHCEVSLSTVYRVLAATPDLPRRASLDQELRVREAKVVWHQACEANPSFSASALRKVVPATWARLYRNAPEWLRAHSPRGLQKPPPRRSTECLRLEPQLFDALAGAKAMCNSEKEPPACASWYRLRALTGVSEYAVRSRTRSWSECLGGESRDAFVRRRIGWARRTAPHLPPAGWAIARLAKLRTKTVHDLLKSSDGERGDS